MIYNNNESYNSLLLQSNNVSIYQRHLRFLTTEIYKSISQKILNLCGRISPLKCCPMIQGKYPRLIYQELILCITIQTPFFIGEH